jgi:hypothetical protein
VVDGVAHRYRMVVAEPCVYDRLDASHALMLLDINQKYGDVVGLGAAANALPLLLAATRPTIRPLGRHEAAPRPCEDHDGGEGPLSWPKAS